MFRDELAAGHDTGRWSGELPAVEPGLSFGSFVGECAFIVCCRIISRPVLAALNRKHQVSGQTCLTVHEEMILCIEVQ